MTRFSLYYLNNKKMRWQPLFVTAVFFLLVLFQPQIADAVAPSGVVLSSKFSAEQDMFFGFKSDPKTVSQFEKRQEVVTEEIPFETEYRDDDKLAWGKEEILQEGEVGKKTLTYEVSFWYGKEISRELVATDIESPEPEIISRGTKIKWKNVPGKDLEYWAKLNVWATSYDSNCLGCSNTTFTGERLRHGVCAVDPTVIPMHTRIYVPGYGVCQAEDIGGAVKGNHIDLAFEDVSQGFWSARHVNVYLLTNAPE